MHLTEQASRLTYSERNRPAIITDVTGTTDAATGASVVLSEKMLSAVAQYLEDTFDATPLRARNAAAAIFRVHSQANE